MPPSIHLTPASAAWLSPSKPRPIAIRGLLRVGDLAIITAPRNTFKSSFALEMAWSLATAEPFLGHFAVDVPMRVGYLQVEIDPGSFQERVRMMGRHTALGPADDPDLWIHSGPLRLDALDDILAAADEHGLQALVFDPIGKMWPEVARGGEAFSENVKGHVQPLLERLNWSGRTIILVHHDPKPSAGGVQNRASGTAALLNDPDVRVLLSRTKVHGRIRVEVENRLQFPAPPFDAGFTDARRLRVLEKEAS